MELERCFAFKRSLFPPYIFPYHISCLFLLRTRLKIGSTHDGGADLGRPDSDHVRLGRRARYEAHPPQRGFRRALAGAIARAIAALLAGLAHTDARLWPSIRSARRRP